jgi:hypothetical protein
MYQEQIYSYELQKLLSKKYSATVIFIMPCVL